MVEELSLKIKVDQEKQNNQQTSSQDTLQNSSALKFRQDLYQAHNELRDLKEHSIQLEEEIKRLRHHRATLQQELKEASLKIQEIDRIKKELELEKKKNAELERSTLAGQSQSTQQDDKLIQGLRSEIEALRKAILLKDQTITALESDHNTLNTTNNTALECALEDQKLLTKELSTRNRELERLISQLIEEKKNQSYLINNSQKQVTDQDEIVKKLYADNESTKSSLSIAQKELSISSEQLRDEILKNEQMRSSLEKAQAEMNTLESKCVELSKELKKSLHEQKEIAALEADRLKIKEELAETKNELTAAKKEIFEDKERISLLEHHLARRVKECSFLSKTQEDLTIQAAELNNKVTQQEVARIEQERKILEKDKLLQELHEKMTQESKENQERLSLSQKEIKSLLREIERYGNEIDRLKQIENKFARASEVMGKFGAIFSMHSQHVDNYTLPERTPTLQNEKISEIETPRIQKQEKIQHSLFTKQAQTFSKQDFFE